jgi:hypothetical protein
LQRIQRLVVDLARERVRPAVGAASGAGVSLTRAASSRLDVGRSAISVASPAPGAAIAMFSSAQPMPMNISRS